jgi:hypothetical protein
LLRIQIDSLRAAGLFNRLGVIGALPVCPEYFCKKGLNSQVYWFIPKQITEII